jgi:hypothetical protein
LPSQFTTFIGKLPHGVPGAVVSLLYISELAPYLDVVGIHSQMLDKDGVDVAADSCVTIAEDAGDAFKLPPYAVLDIDRMSLHQL